MDVRTNNLLCVTIWHAVVVTMAVVVMTEAHIMCDECFCSFDTIIPDEYYRRPEETVITTVVCRNCGVSLGVCWRVEHVFFTVKQ
jgi:Pyruvate/2-oxoacid:ferredoxin oxidoreductase delta subunit